MEFVGGQAVIEGVLIKGKDKIAIAVREPSGNIKIKEEISKTITKKYKILGLPIVRGVIILVETMIIGFKALNYSAAVSIEEEEEKMGTGTLLFTLFTSLVLALLLFKMLPLGIAEFASIFSSWFDNRFLFNFTEGLVKIIILVLYIFAIGQMKDVRRVFQYHGAEHKVVNAFENKDLDNVSKYSTIHVRCGTSFILFVLGLSIIVYLFLPVDISFFSKYALRLLLLPLIAGLAYELIKISPKYDKYFWFKALMSPGLALQKLTTREPDEKQIEVAMAALKRVI
ncbi:MAG: DUF1385 domain-containing protein [Nanoarchaeota archaeon]|nr:DUF1385 domain-containing protein [Nanoarchaeota archaeon]